MGFFEGRTHRGRGFWWPDLVAWRTETEIQDWRKAPPEIRKMGRRVVGLGKEFPRMAVSRGLSRLRWSWTLAEEQGLLDLDFWVRISRLTGITLPLMRIFE